MAREEKKLMVSILGGSPHVSGFDAVTLQPVHLGGSSCGIDEGMSCRGQAVLLEGKR